ncbi:MAG: 30S ribosomal protein S6 [Deltaproteobacteria bacterium]|nr:30S ribosomal protein S6 [Deltaproteobacteria bacterium]
MPEVSASAPKRHNEYETIYVLRPDIDAEGAGRVSSRINEVLARETGTMVKVESWGRRKLAYPVRKYRRGIYIYLRYLGGGKLVAEFERNLRMQKEAVLKFQTIKLADAVDIAAIEVNPEDVKFTAIEPPTEDDREETREKLLGLIDWDHGREDRYRDRDRELEEVYAAPPGVADDDAGDDADDVVPGKGAAGEEK